MKTFSILTIAASLILFTAGCSSDAPEDKGPKQDPKAAAQTAVVHDVKCGCAIASVGKCAEYIKVEDKFIPLKLPATANLGKMPFCKKDGLKAKVEGTVTDGTFVATSFAYENDAKK